ncbi:MAG: PfkB family carbohydrate kinase [Rubrivivax sp.]
MASPVRILGVGHTAVDHQFSIQAFPSRSTKTPAAAYRSGVGGMTANACVAAARLGARVRIASPVGDDGAAPLFEAHFWREGVDPGGLVRVVGEQSSVSAVIVDEQGERLIVNHRGDALRKAPPLEVSQVDQADVLLTDPRCPPWAQAALERARALGRLSILDGDAAPREDLQRLVGLCTWAVFSRPGLAAFHGGSVQQGLAAALASGAEVAVLTQDDQPLWWQRRGGLPAQWPVFEVQPVVDTTAAGDTFHGALAVALGEGKADEEALRFAAAAAALKCTRAGGVQGAPSRAEVEAFLARV